MTRFSDAMCQPLGSLLTKAPTQKPADGQWVKAVEQGIGYAEPKDVIGHPDLPKHSQRVQVKMLGGTAVDAMTLAQLEDAITAAQDAQRALTVEFLSTHVAPKPPEPTLYDGLTAEQCFERLKWQQRECGGAQPWRMTPLQREAASRMWSEQVAQKVRASAEAQKARELSVVIETEVE